MTMHLSDNRIARQDDVAVKDVWVRPSLEVAEINSSTQAGGVLIADQDPNQPS